MIKPASSIIIIATIAWVLNRVAAKYIYLVAQKNKSPKYLYLFMQKCASIIIAVIAIMAVINQLDIEILPLISGIGIGGIALSFAMQDFIENIISGVIILIYRPFKIGSYISFQTNKRDFKGKITKINLRYTTLKSGLNKVLVPNNILTSTAIEVQK